jgi:hypothetical protein
MPEMDQDRKQVLAIVAGILLPRPESLGEGEDVQTQITTLGLAKTATDVIQRGVELRTGGEELHAC